MVQGSGLQGSFGFRVEGLVSGGGGGGGGGGGLCCWGLGGSGFGTGFFVIAVNSRSWEPG